MVLLLPIVFMVTNGIAHNIQLNGGIGPDLDGRQLLYIGISMKYRKSINSLLALGNLNISTVQKAAILTSSLRICIM